MKRLAIASGASVALALAASPALAQRRPSYFDRPAALRVVGTPAPGEHPPLVVYLPPTGGTAAELEGYARRFVGFANYVVLLPEGAPTRAEYADFDRYSAWFDARVTEDIARARATYGIDPERIYVVGFSLGGDLAWAMLGMHPDRFAGAFVMGSRCGAHVSTRAMRTMQTRRTRIVFAIGDRDLAARDRGLRAAQHRSEQAGIATRLVVFHGLHEPPDEATMRAGFAFFAAAP